MSTSSCQADLKIHWQYHATLPKSILSSYNLSCFPPGQDGTGFFDKRRGNGKLMYRHPVSPTAHVYHSWKWIKLLRRIKDRLTGKRKIGTDNFPTDPFFRFLACRFESIFLPFIQPEAESQGAGVSLSPCCRAHV